MRQTFEQLKEKVLSLPNSEGEYHRIIEEIELFEKRGWNDYISFAINLLREYEEKIKYFFPSLSVMDSLFVRKVLHPQYDYEKFLTKQYSKDILFNDALRLGIDIVYADPEELVYLNELAGHIAEEYLKRSRLCARAKGKPSKTQVGKYDKIVCAVSNRRVPTNDFQIIFNEEKDGPREEIDILSNYLLIYVTSNVGI